MRAAGLAHPTDEARNADVAGCLPDCDSEACGLDLGNEVAAEGIINRRQIDAGGVLQGGGPQPPQGGAVALDHLAQAMQDGLRKAVAGGQTGAGEGEVIVRGGGGEIVQLYDLVGRPDRLAIDKIDTLHPAASGAGPEMPAAAPGQALGVDHRGHPFQGVVGHHHLGPADRFGVIAFDRLHEAADLGGLQCCALALVDRQRARPRSTDADHRNADAIKPGGVPDAGDANPRGNGHEAWKGLRRQA